MSRKPKKPIPVVYTAILVGALCVLIAVLVSQIPALFQSLAPKDSTHLTQAVAATIQDRPECAHFKDEILRHASESPLAGSTQYAVGIVKQNANKAGCGRN